jgi:hypothetical protein
MTFSPDAPMLALGDKVIRDPAPRIIDKKKYEEH